MRQAAIPEGIIAAIDSWSRQAGSDQPAQGPTLADLGGATLVAAAADALADSPWFLYLVDVAGNASQGTATASPDDEVAQIDAAVAAGFGKHERPSSYASAVARLLRYPELTSRLNRALERAFLNQVEAGTIVDASAQSTAIAGSALEALVHLTTTNVIKPHRLLALCVDLVDLLDTAPAEFKRRVPRLAGILHEHFRDDDLITLLRRLADDPDADNDATFELALFDLRTALNADDFPTIVDGLLRARRGFAAASGGPERRPDADAYAAAIDAIVAFNRPDVMLVQEASARLHQAVAQHAAWLAGCYSPPWMTNRNQEERAWHQLTVFLASAATPISDDAWYRADEAIGALIDAYRASRSFTRRVGGEPHSLGVEQLVRPVIEATFVDNARSLSLLDQALATEERFQRDEAAQQLSEAVRAAVAAAHSPLPATRGGGGLGKDSRRVPATLRYFKADSAQAILELLPENLQQELEGLLYDNRIARLESGNPKVESMLDELERQLVTSPDWPVAGKHFRLLVQQTVLFLMRCYNVGSSTGGTRTAYLNTTSTDPTPKERLLQSDYLDWLKQGPYYATARAEVPDVAAGRADVVIELTGISLYVECKREETDASRSGLRKYAGQARAYSVTNVAFGILLVLDLTPHPTGNPDLFSSVWIEHVQVGSEETPRQIVVARVPGNRRVPHVTRTP